MQCSASLDSGRRHMVSNIPMRTEGTKCNDNGGDEITSGPVPNSLSRSSNIGLTRTEGDEITSLSGSSNMDLTRAEGDNNDIHPEIEEDIPKLRVAVVVDVRTEKESEANETKGLLNFVSALVRVVFVFYSALATFATTNPSSEKALLSFDSTATKVICIVILTTWMVGSVVLIPLAAHFKGCKSISHTGFDIFLWLLFLWWLSFVVEFCTTVHTYLLILHSIIWPVGAAVFIATSFASVVYIENQRPTLVSSWAKHIVTDAGSEVATDKNQEDADEEKEAEDGPSTSKRTQNPMCA